MTPACFHMLKDVLLRKPQIRHFKMHMASSDRLFNEMFLEIHRFYEDLVRRGPSSALKIIELSKGMPPIKFREELKLKPGTVDNECLYIPEGSSLSEVIYRCEMAKRFLSEIK